MEVHAVVLSTCPGKCVQEGVPEECPEAGGEKLYWGASCGNKKQELRAVSQAEHLWHHHSVRHMFGPQYVFVE